MQREPIPSNEGVAEYVAYKLLQHVASVERKSFFPNPGDGSSTADRQWILDTYTECLNTVKNARPPRNIDPR